jgi:hypothetical protein
MCLENMSGTVCGMPDGATTIAQMAKSSATPIGERQNTTPIYVTGVTDARLPGIVTSLVSEWAVNPDLGGEAYACSSDCRRLQSHGQCTAVT